jgi:hypothetical protein
MTDRLAQTRDYLAAIPKLLDQLPRFAVPGTQPRDDDAGGKRQKRVVLPSPIVLDVIDLAAERKPGWLAWQPGDDPTHPYPRWRHGVPGTLRLWAWRAAWDGHRSPVDVDGNLGPVVAWLADQGAWMIEHYPGFAGDIRRMHGALQRACGVRPEVAYHCPSCGWIIKPRDQGAWWSCTGCHRTWAYANEISNLLAQQADLVTLRQAAVDLGRPVKTLQKWTKHGHLPSIAVARTGARLYSLATARRVSEMITVGRPRASKSA